jgi:hypothetical protein
MTDLFIRLDDWSDRLSPMVVKEIRQMVRGREFNYSFGISLLAGLVVAFFGLADSLTSAGTSGASVFTSLMICLSVLGLIVVPLGGFSALRSERVDQTLDLITQTSLTSRRIVIGKLMTQGVKLVILFAGLSPFIAMSFLLGGVDLMTILLSLTMLFMWSLWICAACLFMSCASQSRAVSGALFAGMIAVFIWILTSLSNLVVLILGGIPGMPRPSFSGMWWVLAGSTAVCLVSMTNLVLLAENRISLQIEDRSTALRVGFFVQFLLIVAAILGPYAAGAPGYTVVSAIQSLGLYAGIQLAVTAMFTTTEDLLLSRRVSRRIQPSLKWPWLAIFRPGGGRGAAWVLTQMLIFLVAAAWLTSAAPLDFRWFLAICGYICFFTGVPTVILRHGLRARARSAHLRAAILLFFPVVAISADLLQYFFTPNLIFDGTFSAYHILNPFRALANWSQVEAQSWYWRVMIMGFAGLVAYLELFRMGRREDKHVGNPG